MSDKIAFVRTEMLEQKAPPASTTGFVGWARANLFNGIGNSILTLLCIYCVYYILSGLIPWLISPTWKAESLTECREMIAAAGKHGHAACWGVVRERFIQLLFGFYPPEGYWRVILALVLVGAGLAPVLFDKAPRKLLIVTGLFPFIVPFLLWGGLVWPYVGVLLGFVVGYFTLKYATEVLGDLMALIAAVVAAFVWWLFLSGPIMGALGNILPIGLESVESRQFGGLMLAITIGLTAILASLPIGILLALGRQSDLLIVKAMCIGFIEFIRGVPLITLLFVASTLLNIFLPPGTNFDIIVRVIIMVTLFASAYMAEVVRGGLAALPKGQYEAADALGLDYWKAQRLIIMPQALKISIPGIVSTFIGVFKDTTLVSVIGLLDPLGLSNAIRADQAWNGIVWELYGLIGVLFFVCCFSMSRYSMYLERKLQTGHK